MLSSVKVPLNNGPAAAASQMSKFSFKNRLNIQSTLRIY